MSVVVGQRLIADRVFANVIHDSEGGRLLLVVLVGDVGHNGDIVVAVSEGSPDSHLFEGDVGSVAQL